MSMPVLADSQKQGGVINQGRIQDVIEKQGHY